MIDKLLEAKKELSKDNVLKKIIDLHKLDVEFEQKQKSPFYFLCTSIISQQLSSNVASVISKRFYQLFKNSFPEPTDVLKLDNERLLGIGLSRKKSEYLQHLSEYFISNDQVIQNLDAMDDDKVIKTLTKIHGIGVWTVEMFLMFSLHRQDVFSIGDLALYNSVKMLYKINKKKPKEERQEIYNISKCWSPFRTFASFYLWRWYENGKIEL